MSSSSLGTQQPGTAVAQDAQLLCEHTAALVITNNITYPFILYFLTPALASAPNRMPENFPPILSIVLVMF
jgi:hypothetical protein